MKWTIGTKVGGLVVFPIVILIVLSVMSFRMINDLITSAEWTNHTYDVMEHQELVLSLIKDAETGQRGFLITGEDRYLEPYNNALRGVYERIKTVKELTADNPAQQARLDRLKVLVDAKLAELKETLDLRRNVGFEAALDVVVTDRGKKVMDDIRIVHDEIINEETQLLEVRQATMESDAELTKSILIYGSVISILLILFFGFTVVRNISKPIKQITMTAERIAEGDLNAELDINDRSDEVGILNRAFAKMVEQLRKSLSEINEGITLLGSSSSEILAATTQVASGSAETATAISETTTTVEEVRQAAQLSSQKAAKVSENSQQVSQVTETGQKAVDETVKGMHNIQSQMESVANTIVRLSEQSQQIGGIIASVTDVADQSNLLAVNASIEAAKAGEQGKGFAVVAQEIKNLAQQSKQATIQVRNILMDVQKATSAAVMATEQTSKAVENGVKQSTQAGDAIKKLAESSKRALEAAYQIVASSQQQTIGMDQIGLAMQNINQAGTENAASMQQAEKAAQGLTELGQKLKLMVEQYKI